MSNFANVDYEEALANKLRLSSEYGKRRPRRQFTEPSAHDNRAESAAMLRGIEAARDGSSVRFEQLRGRYRKVRFSQATWMRNQVREWMREAGVR